MARAAGARLSQQGEQTRIALIEAAEMIIAADGLEGFSARKLATRIGASNNAVVSYHFGSNQALIEAIYRHRLPAIEARRQQLMDQAHASGTDRDPATLLRALWQPLLEQTDAEGRHSYCGFLSEVIRSGLGRSRWMLTADFPVTQRLRAKIEAAAPDHFAQMAEMKWHLLTQWSLETLRYIDKELDLPGEECARYFNEAVDMVAATLKAGNLAELSGKAVQS